MKFPFRPEHIVSSDFEIFVGGNPSARNVLIFTEYVNATYFISFDIPLRQLHQQGNINFAAASQKFIANQGPKSWERMANVFKPDLVVMTRYGQIDGPEILASFQSRGVPVIYHIDDNLLELSASLGAEIQKRHGEVADTRRMLMERCDLIYASTPNLAEVLRKKFPSQRIFCGIYAPYMGNSVRERRSVVGCSSIIGYMGSKGHQQDLESVIPAIARLMDERTDLRFEVFGSISMPISLLRFGDRVVSHSVQKSYPEFLAELANLGWSLGLAPLVDEPFNRCKAPTKYIEYSAAGIPTIASYSPVYGEVVPPEAGLLVADNDWYGAISFWLDRPGLAKSALSLAQEYCAGEFSLDNLAKQLTYVFDLVRDAREVIYVYVGADRSQQLAIKVLEHSIRRNTTAPVKVIPMIDLDVPVPKDPRNSQRTGFSFSRFCIPALAGYRGKGIYMDADMQVFKDIRALWDLPFNGKKVLVQHSVKHTEETLKKENAPATRKKQCSVMLLDCANLDWNIDQIVRDLDKGLYDYSKLMDELCLEPENNIGYDIPFEWNSLEHYRAETCLIHYTDMGTQPWVSTRNPNSHVWLGEVREMLNNGSLNIDELKHEIRQGYFRPSLVREIKYGQLVPAFLRALFNALNSVLDKLQGYVPHQSVYKAKKARNKAITTYSAATKATGN